MNQEKRNIFIYIFIALLLLLVIYLISVSNLFQPQLENTDKTIQQVFLSIIAPTWSLSYNSTNTTNITVSDLLFECAQIHNFSVEKEYFTGYDSYVISSINGTVNGENDSYWQFYVNGEFAVEGCHALYLKNNDRVEWKFEPLQW
jgi:hypothetical protein